MSGSSGKKSDYEVARELAGSLSAQLSHFTAALEKSSPVIAEAYQTLVVSLTRAGVGAAAPKSGDLLPPFTLTNENGRLVTSAELLPAGPLVISFNRGHWCPFCWLELSAFQDQYEEVKRLGAEIISITPDTAAYSKQLKARLGLGFPVLTDLDNAYAMELGLVMALPDEVKVLFHEIDLHLNLYQKNDAWFVPIPATFLVHRDGIIRDSYVNADFRQRMEPSILIEEISALH